MIQASPSRALARRWSACATRSGRTSPPAVWCCQIRARCLPRRRRPCRPVARWSGCLQYRSSRQSGRRAADHDEPIRTHKVGEGGRHGVTSPSRSDDSRRRHPSLVPSVPQPFAHPSERLFSQLLTLYGHEWIYEPLEFPLEWDERGTPIRGFRPGLLSLPDAALHRTHRSRTATRDQEESQDSSLPSPVPRDSSLLVVYQRDFTNAPASHDLRIVDGRAA